MSALAACLVVITAASAQAQQGPYPPGAPQTPYPPQAPPPGYPAPALASPAPLGVYVPPPGSKEHDGLYARLMLGPGYTNMTAGDTSISGAGLGFELALGYALAPNFALFADFVANGAVTPTTRSGSSMRELKDTTAFLQNYGAGAAYFIMPANIFIAGSLCGAKMSINDTSGEESKTLARTRYGIGGNFSVGKEWWVGSELGVGAALQAAVASIPGDDDKSPKWTAWGLMLALTATLN